MTGKFVKLKQREKLRQNDGKIRQIDHPVSRNFIPTKNMNHPVSRNFIPTKNMNHPGVGIKFLPWVPITKNRKNIFPWCANESRLI